METRESSPATEAILFREDCFDFSLEGPQEGRACWLTSFLLKPGPQWALGELEGDMSVLEADRGRFSPANVSAEVLELELFKGL